MAAANFLLTISTDGIIPLVLDSTVARWISPIDCLGEKQHSVSYLVRHLSKQARAAKGEVYGIPDRTGDSGGCMCRHIVGLQPDDHPDRRQPGAGACEGH